MTSSSQFTVYLMGDSHTKAIDAAAKAATLPFHLNIINVRELRPMAGVKALVDPKPTDRPQLHTILKELIPVNSPDLFLSSFGGNTHNVFGLLNHPTPFDFVLPSDPSLPLSDDAVLVPFDVLKDVFLPFAEGYLFEIEALRNTYKGYVGHLESPPPIGDDNYVRRFLDPFFHDKAKIQSIAPRHLRYKLWRLHSEIVADHCIKCGIDFVSAPQASRSTDGFLLPAGYSRSATHANEWYGSLVLSQIAELVMKQRR